MDPTEYQGKGNNQKTTSLSWEENIQAKRLHTSMKIPLDLEHGKLEVTSPASTAGPPPVRPNPCSRSRTGMEPAAGAVTPDHHRHLR